jgi:hypothetical protein
MYNINFIINLFIRSDGFTISDTDGGMATLSDKSLQNLVRIAPNISGSIR